MASAYEHFSSTSNNNSVASQRTSITSLLNPEPEEQSYNASSSYSSQIDADLYEYDNNYQNSTEDHSLVNQESQSWRRYSVPNLMPESSSSDTANNNDLTIINYCNGTSSSQQSQVDSSASQSAPVSPMCDTSPSPKSEYNGTSNGVDKPSKRSTSSSVPSSRRSSMNRASDSGQTITSSSNGNSNMITPPQTPGIKSPTKANFSFPPSSNGNDQQNSQQIMPPKVKRKRISPEQLQDLVAMFEQTDTPSYDVREKLAKKLNMTNREVQVWFQNRRAKANRAKANEHNASHQHHRFLHHHSISTAQAASGHASINMMPHGNFTFVPMFANGSPSTGGPVRGRSNRRHSYVPPATNNNQKKASQNTPLTRPRASTVTGAPMTSMSSHMSLAGPHSIHHQQQQSHKMMGVPPPIKILSFEHHLHHSHHPGYGYAHSVPPSPISPMTPMSPTTPTLPPINYMLSGINNLTLPPPVAVPPIKDLLSSAADYQPSGYQQQQQQATVPTSHNSHQRLIGYTTTTTKTADIISSEPSPIELLATAAELVQCEEKEKERLKALAVNDDNDAQEEAGDDKKWRPWLI